MLVIARKVLTEQDIEQDIFLTYTLWEWRRTGLPIGIAGTLVQIADRVKKESWDKVLLKGLPMKEIAHTITPSFLGNTMLKRVRENNRFIELTEIKDGKAVLSDAVYDELLGIENEQILIATLSPYLDDILESSNIQFVNSMHFNWLALSENTTLMTGLRPDGFITMNELYDKKDEPMDIAIFLRHSNGKKYRFGVPYRGLQDSIITMQGKLKIDNVALGEVIQYLQFLKDPQGAILFSNKEFWLLSCERLIRDIDIKSIQRCPWNLPGSADYLLEFVHQCSTMNMKLILDATKQLGANVKGYLGRGSIGRVYRAVYKDMEVALKIVRKETMVPLCREYHYYEYLKEMDCVASAVDEPVQLMNGLGCVLMTQPVGRALSLERPLSDSNIKRACSMLCKLHEAGVTHGDPRVENLILVEHGLKWIDLKSVVPIFLSGPLDDCIVLACSLLRCQESDLPASVLDGIKEYVISLKWEPLADLIIQSSRDV